MLECGCHCVYMYIVYLVSSSLLSLLLFGVAYIAFPIREIPHKNFLPATISCKDERYQSRYPGWFHVLLDLHGNFCGFRKKADPC